MEKERRTGETPLTAKEAWRARADKNRQQNSAAGSGGAESRYYGPMQPRSRKGQRPVIVFAFILAGVILLGLILSAVGFEFGHSDRNVSETADASGKHLSVLFIEGTISEDDTDYDHQYVLDCIDGMMENDQNKGMMLYVNTPGGGVYESDEVYLKIREYQQKTKRPVYVYMASQATSGGYYISASADKIVANRNCWTGSIGVTLGTLLDLSGLLEEYDIKTETITSGKNKAMGSMLEPMTEEQRKIFQSLVDEAYDQFVEIVAQGRNLDEKRVREIADGRIYTASQAQKLQLIDQVVNTYQDALTDMKEEYGLTDCEVYEFRYEPSYGLFDGLIESIDRLAGAAGQEGDISAIVELMEKNGELPLQYLCEVTK